MRMLGKHHDALQNGFDAGGDFRNVKRLGNIIIRAKIQPHHLIVQFPFCRQKDKRNMRSHIVLSDLFTKFETIHLRHRDIGQNQIRKLFSG